MESGSYGLNGSLQTRGGHQLRASLNRNYEDLLRPLPLSNDVAIPIGSYWFTDVSLNFSPSQGGWIRPSGNIVVGRFYDGSRISAAFSPAWSVSRHARLSATYEINHLDFDDRDERFTSHVVRARKRVHVLDEDVVFPPSCSTTATRTSWR